MQLLDGSQRHHGLIFHDVEQLVDLLSWAEVANSIFITQLWATPMTRGWLLVIVVFVRLTFVFWKLLRALQRRGCLLLYMLLWKLVVSTEVV